MALTSRCARALPHRYRPRPLERALPLRARMGMCSAGRLLMFFLFVWWAVAAGIITFDGPFEVHSPPIIAPSPPDPALPRPTIPSTHRPERLQMVGNGYFATWFGFIFAVNGLGSTATDVRPTQMPRREPPRRARSHRFMPWLALAARPPPSGSCIPPEVPPGISSVAR